MTIAPTNAALGLTTGPVLDAQSRRKATPTKILITLRAFDNGSPSLSATLSFHPESDQDKPCASLAPYRGAAHRSGGTLTATNIRVHVYIPSTNLLTYTLLGAPLGVAISNGIINWSPSGSGSSQITTRATDNGTPAAASYVVLLR